MKNIFIEEREIRQPKLIHALITFGCLIAVMAVGIIVFEVDPHIPMFIGVIISAVMAMYLGYNWSQIEKMMVDGISKAMQSILILAIVGMMIGTWLCLSQADFNRLYGRIRSKALLTALEVGAFAFVVVAAYRNSEELMKLCVPAFMLTVSIIFSVWHST